MPSLTEVVPLNGGCHASAACLIGDRWLVVARDSTNELLIYDWANGPTDAPPVARHQVLPNAAESADFEGMARLGNQIWLIASHDAHDGTERKVARQQLGFVPFSLSNGRLTLGPATFSSRLIEDGQWATQMRGIMGNTVGRTRTDPLGLSIEALAAGPNRSLLIGFRTPVHSQKALVQRLENPEGLVYGEPPKFVGPRWLDLGGRGIRGMAQDQERWLLVAGSITDHETSAKLYRWAEFDAVTPPQGLNLDFGELVPETLVQFRNDWFVISDDPPATSCQARVARVAIRPIF